MEQIVILVLFVAASIVSSILQNKRKRDAERRLDPEAAGKRRPFERWPQTTADWQDELRRLLEQPAAPTATVPPPSHTTLPPVIGGKGASGPVVPAAERSEGDEIFPSPFVESGAAYARASGLQERVAEAMRVVDRETENARPSASVVRSRRPVVAWTRDPKRLREAFVASLVFGRPVALREEGE